MPTNFPLFPKRTEHRSQGSRLQSYGSGFKAQFYHFGVLAFLSLSFSSWQRRAELGSTCHTLSPPLSQGGCHQMLVFALSN